MAAAAAPDTGGLVQRTLDELKEIKLTLQVTNDFAARTVAAIAELDQLKREATAVAETQSSSPNSDRSKEEAKVVLALLRKSEMLTTVGNSVKTMLESLLILEMFADIDEGANIANISSGVQTS